MVPFISTPLPPGSGRTAPTGSPPASTFTASVGGVIAGVLLLVTGGCADRSSSVSDASAGPVVQLSDANFDREVLQSDQPVLVDMWAPWCSPCVRMKPEIARLAGQVEGEIKVAELNVDENPAVAQRYSIEQLPTLMIFVDGEIANREVGGRPLNALLELVQPHRVRPAG